LWDYLDGELSPERMDAIRAHLVVCQRCYPHAEFGTAFLSAVAAARREHTNPERLRDRVTAALRTEGMTVA
jgi:hypothetical protein